MAEQAIAGDFWSDLWSFGESAIEGIGEKLNYAADGWIDLQLQKQAEKAGNPQNAKENEPTKGTTVEGQPIVVTSQPTIAQALTGNTGLMIAGAGLLIGVVLLARR